MLLKCGVKKAIELAWLRFFDMNEGHERSDLSVIASEEGTAYGCVMQAGELNEEVILLSRTRQDECMSAVLEPITEKGGDEFLMFWSSE